MKFCIYYQDSFYLQRECNIEKKMEYYKPMLIQKEENKMVNDIFIIFKENIANSQQKISF